MMSSFAVLSYCDSENLGDEIQSIAAARMLPRVEATLDRDHLHQDRGHGGLDVILNGWFLNSRQWPPADDVNPLLVSFYAPLNRPHLYDRRLREWYGRHAPIGCRSLAAVDSLTAIGVDAYFSGCLTLCLPPSPVERGAEVCIVDCDAEMLRRLVPARVLERATFLTHAERTDARSLWRRVTKRARRTLDPRSPHLMWSLTAVYRRRRHLERMALAQALLDRYARARLVITSRLHCFLPCLALGTPVLLLNSTADPHRYSGLSELGRSYAADIDRIDVDWDNPSPNPDRHKRLAADLTATCRAWVDRTLTRPRATP